MKTVLAPNAPWPSKEKPVVKKPLPPKKRSKIQKTDEMFQQWASKNIGVKL
jgi:hypothetical protein